MLVIWLSRVLELTMLASIRATILPKPLILPLSTGYAICSVHFVSVAWTAESEFGLLDM